MDVRHNEIHLLPSTSSVLDPLVWSYRFNEHPGEKVEKIYNEIILNRKTAVRRSETCGECPEYNGCMCKDLKVGVGESYHCDKPGLNRRSKGNSS